MKLISCMEDTLDEKIDLSSFTTEVNMMQI